MVFWLVDPILSRMRSRHIQDVGLDKRRAVCIAMHNFCPTGPSVDLRLHWGEAVQVKINAAELLETTLARMKPEVRRTLRIFMSSTTDPYQLIENTYHMTRRCLEVFSRYPDLDLLVVQTRSPLAERDIPLLSSIPYVWLSVTIETDEQAYLKRLRGGPMLEKRWQLVREASNNGVHTQITVSPCLPYTRVEAFGQRLLRSGAKRIVVDTVVDGDGSEGKRTARSAFAKVEADWAETTQAHMLYDYLSEHKERARDWVEQCRILWNRITREGIMASATLLIL